MPRIPSSSATRAELRELLFDYNWDDGLELPRAIAAHPGCDLSLALDLFWLADAYEALLSSTVENEFSIERLAFGRALAQDILGGRYPRTDAAFKPPLSRTQRHLFGKDGLPAIFLTDIP